ncbi:hypothetical protein [Noviherbaspirillum denitrificans]|uniref:hypothetical protein n=1 Tax=Noviherbaspirillum denitrificans TaxID=1968433 RepID=UPI001482972F|nr:hypothetical protein [Noviherbaspirillum denitrificans]
MLVNGQRTDNWHPIQVSDSDGRFLRQRSGFQSLNPGGIVPAGPHLDSLPVRPAVETA